MKRKILAVVLCGIMALSLGACGSKDNGGSAKTDDGSAKKEASGGENYCQSILMAELQLLYRVVVH